MGRGHSNVGAAARAGRGRLRHGRAERGTSGPGENAGGRDEAKQKRRRRQGRLVGKGQERLQRLPYTCPQKGKMINSRAPTARLTAQIERDAPRSDSGGHTYWPMW
jgi:hypothetical protein